jgi:leukotriene-A4 hydrolase
MTRVPYEKGALFLLALERKFGRERFDRFLRGYFDRFAFQSITTAQAVDYLKQHLSPKIDFESWIEDPGLSADAPVTTSEAFAKVELAATPWAVRGRLPAAKLWSSHEWIHFLRALPPALSHAQMEELDGAFHFTQSGNNEVLQQWLLMSIRNTYSPADQRLREFLMSVGRRKYIKPLYEELAKTPEGRDRALQIYEKARSGYHPISQATVDLLLS